MAITFNLPTATVGGTTVASEAGLEGEVNRVVRALVDLNLQVAGTTVNFCADVATGEAASSDGDIFAVPSADADGVLDYYQMSGASGVLLGTIADKTFVEKAFGPPFRLNSFAELASRLRYSGATGDQIDVADGDVVITPDGAYTVLPTSVTGSHYNYTGTGGVNLARIIGEADQTAAAHFWKRVRGGSADAYVFIGSDSTGNESWEWPYLWADWLADAATTHTVKIRFWDSGALSWGAYTTLGTGTGSQTIFVDVCAVAGSNSQYLQGGNEGAIFARSDYSLAILNYGHNLGTNAREASTFYECLMAAAHLRWRCPFASIVVTAQNPRTSENGFGQSVALAATWRKVADLVGCGLIDAQAYFLGRGDWDTALMLDETHPNGEGQLIWLDAVKSALREPAHLSLAPASVSAQPSLTVVGVNWCKNPFFEHWTGAAPDYWTASNCTVAKQPGRVDGALYSMEITASGASGSVYQSVPATILQGLKSKRVMILARVWKSAGMSSLAGRIDITSSNGATSVSGTSRAWGDQGAGGWAWICTGVDVQPDATSLTVRIYSGDGTDSGKKLWVQSFAAFVSQVPLGLDTLRLEAMVVDNYYSDLLVHPKSAADNGTLTATSTGFTVSGATAGQTNTIVEMPPLEAGQTYRLAFDAGDGDGVANGGVYARSGAGGGGSTLSGAAWSRNTAGYTLDFTPTTSVASLWFFTSGSGTGMTMTNVSVAKL